MLLRFMGNPLSEGGSDAQTPNNPPVSDSVACCRPRLQHVQERAKTLTLSLRLICDMMTLTPAAAAIKQGSMRGGSESR